MLTPQDIESISFEKAVFGGYDMQSVDDVLEPLTQDYLTLYKENALLKSKMRLLVEKLEEYRAAEDQMKASQAEAQKKCDAMVAEAEQRCAAMAAEAKAQAEDRSRTTDAALTGEKERLNRAKASTREFIATVEANIQKQLEALGTLKLMDLEAETVQPVRQEPVRKAYDYESEMDEPIAPAKQSDSAEKIAEEIEQSVERIVGSDNSTSQSQTRVLPNLRQERGSDKFDNLQFGPNYNPTNR